MKDPIAKLAQGGIGFHRLEWKGRRLTDPAVTAAQARVSAPFRPQLEAEGVALLSEIDSRGKDPAIHGAARAQRLRLDIAAGRKR